MSDVLPAELTELVPLQSIRIVLLVLAGRIISLLADRTGQVDDISHLPSPEPSTLSRQAHFASRLLIADRAFLR